MKKPIEPPTPKEVQRILDKVRGIRKKTAAPTDLNAVMKRIKSGMNLNSKEKI